MSDAISAESMIFVAGRQWSSLSRYRLTKGVPTSERSRGLVIAGDWLSNMKSVARLTPVKEGRRWRGRKGMLLERKTLRDGASLGHCVVDVIIRD